MKILIIRLSSIGDCVLASPVVEALQERYPAAHLAWAVQAKSLPVVRGLPGLAETLVWYDRRRRYRTLLHALWRTWRAHFDITLDLQGLDKAGLFAFASGAKRRVSGVGARNIAHWSSNERVVEDDPVHARLFYLRRAAPLDIAPDAAERFYPRVPITEAHRHFADKFLAQAGIEPAQRLIGLNLGAAHPHKRWPAERFAQLASELLAKDHNARIIVFGGPEDVALLRPFEDELERHTPRHPSTPWRERVVIAVKRTRLMQLAALSERCTAFVTADTGPMHIVAAVGAPMVALFGPTDPAQTGPVHKPGNAPIHVLDALRITGAEARPASLDAMEVEPVFNEVRELMNEVEALKMKDGSARQANGTAPANERWLKPELQTQIA